MRKRVYIETTIPSFYFEVRSDPSMVARREWTRRWWDDARTRHDLVTSEAVIDELSQGDFPAREDCLRLIETVPLVPVEAGVVELVHTYIVRRVMPRNPVGDALHLALASHHRCDFLVTWNCGHLANANKFDHIRRVNTMLGVFVPAWFRNDGIRVPPSAGFLTQDQAPQAPGAHQAPRVARPGREGHGGRVSRPMGGGSASPPKKDGLVQDRVLPGFEPGLCSSTGHPSGTSGR